MSTSSTSLEEGEIREEGEISASLQGEVTSSPSSSSYHSRPHARSSIPGEWASRRAASRAQLQEDEPEDLDRDIHYLLDSIQNATRAVGLQDCLKNLSGVCHDLDRAISKAQHLHRLLNKRDADIQGAETNVDLAKAGVRILNGLRSLHVFSTMGQGREMAAAQHAVRAAWHDRVTLFTAAQRKQLEAWVRGSRRLAALLPRDAGVHEPAQPSLLPQQGSQGAAAARPAELARPSAPQPALVPPPPPPPPVVAPSGTPPSGAACLQPVTKSTGDKRSHASDEDSGSSGASSKRSRLGQQPAAAARSHLQLSAQHQQQAVSKQDGVHLPGAPPPPPRPVAPVHSAGSSSMELADSGGAPSVAGQAAAALDAPYLRTTYNPSDAILLADAESALCHAPERPAASQLHGVVVSEDVRGLLGRGKLCLVLDLDHTLLNSARYAEVDPGLQERLERRCSAEAGVLPEQERLLFRMDDIKMWTKLRPGVRQFLQTAAQNYELWIHTNGNKTYAAAITKLLDPTGELFGQRVIAQGAERLDEMQADQAKSFMQGLEGREAVTVIVDDSHSVWAQHRRNLVVVERYVYFPSSRLQLGISRPSLLEANRDECFEQGMLPTTLDVLLRVHKRVLAAVSAPPITLPSGEEVYANWDVRHVLGEERQGVLRGVVLVFSRVFPLDRRPETHPLWQMAESFGARCTTAMDAGVTHVVAAAGGTEKVMQARQRGLYIVTPGWLECSCILWKRALEDRFPVPL